MLLEEENANQYKNAGKKKKKKRKKKSILVPEAVQAEEGVQACDNLKPAAVPAVCIIHVHSKTATAEEAQRRQHIANTALEAAVCTEDLEQIVGALNSHAKHGNSKAVAAARTLRKQLRHVLKKQRRQLRQDRVATEVVVESGLENPVLLAESQGQGNNAEPQVKSTSNTDPSVIPKRSEELAAEPVQNPEELAKPWYAVMFEQLELESDEKLLDAVQAQDSNAAADTSWDECVVCLVAKKTHVCIPCGHQCVCSTCARNIVPNTPNSLCPLCRTPCVFVLDQNKVFV